MDNGSGIGNSLKNGNVFDAGRETMMVRPEIGGMNPQSIETVERFAGAGEMSVKTVAEMEEKGIFTEDSPDLDATGDGQVDGTQALMMTDAAKENGVVLSVEGYFTDKKKENLSEEVVKEVGKMVEKEGDDPAAIVDLMNKARVEALMGMFDRRYPDGGIEDKVA